MGGRPEMGPAGLLQFLCPPPHSACPQLPTSHTPLRAPSLSPQVRRQCQEAGSFLTPAPCIGTLSTHRAPVLGHGGRGLRPQSWPLSSLQPLPPRAPLQNYELILHEGSYKVVQRGPGGDLPYKIRYMGIYLAVETRSGVVVSWDRKTSVFIRLHQEYKVGVAGCGTPLGRDRALAPRPGPAVHCGS